MEQMELSTKTEVEAGAISTAHIDSEIHLNRMKGEPGLLQSEDSEPVLSLKEEILEDAAAMDQMEMPISNEVEMAATYSERSNSEIDLDFFKQDPGLLQSVKSEPFFTYEALLKEEILKDRTRDGSEQQCVHVASTSTGTGLVNEACSTSLHDLLNVKYEPSEMDIGPIVLQHMDTHYTIKKNRMSTATEKNAIVDDSDEAMPGSGIRKGSVENKRRDGNEQQYLQSRSTAASPGSLYEANSTNKDDWLHVKQELADIDIGPTVLQHMDIHHALNKSPVDGCNEAMRYSRIKNSAENKLRDSLEPHKAIKKERSRPLQSLQHTVHEDCLASLCRVDVMRLDVFQCDLCHVVYTEKLKLLQHLQTGHACPSRTSLSIQFRQTNKRNVSGYKIKCGYCGQTTSEEDYDEAHLKSCLGQQKGLQQRLLRRHQTISSNCFRCDSCDKTFRKLHLLSAHRKLHDRKIGIFGMTSSPSSARRSEVARAETKLFKCDVCEKRYSSEKNLCVNKGFHSSVGLSAGHICSAKFNTKSNSTTRLRTHTGEKHYQCGTCNARFTNSSNLTTHKRVHTGEKPYQCGTCNAIFADSSNLTTHKRVHIGEKPYQCDICNARFTTSSNLIKHKRVHTGEKPYQCDTCNARFTTNDSLIRHKRVHSGEKPFQCDTCNAKFAYSSNLAAHKRVHTGEKPYQCDPCNARFTTHGNLISHKRVHSGEAAYQCDICNARFTTRSNLIRHKRVHSGKTAYQCDICNARFTNNSNLTTHKRVHTGERPYQCDTCNARFTNSSNLTTHKRVHTGEKPYQCGTCNAKFADSSNLIAHKRVHSGETAYQCDICNARFRTTTNLVKHKRVHTGEKPYQCDTCNARFTTNDSLIRHKRVHSSEKPYQCDTCNAKFANSSNLTAHKRVHTGEKPYQCDICNARFTTSSNLIRHERVHSGEKPYQCDTCNARFTTNASLKIHMSSHRQEALPV